MIMTRSLTVLSNVVTWKSIQIQNIGRSYLNVMKIGLTISMRVLSRVNINEYDIHEDFDSLDPIIEKIAHIIQTHRNVDTRS